MVIDVFYIVFTFIIIAFIVLGVVSFTLFIRRSSRNSAAKINQTAELNQKLDRIIELLEKEKNK